MSSQSHQPVTRAFLPQGGAMASAPTVEASQRTDASSPEGGSTEAAGTLAGEEAPPTPTRGVAEFP